MPKIVPPKNIAQAPISSPVHSQQYSMWFEQIGRHLNAATNVRSNKNESNSKLYYVISGSVTHINYTGLGDTTLDLPDKCTMKSIIPVSNGTQIILEVGASQIVIPKYDTEQTVHGSYFNG